jgi:hypothetical protein
MFITTLICLGWKATYLGVPACYATLEDGIPEPPRQEELFTVHRSFRYFELLLRTLKFSQDILEQERDCFWPVAGRETDKCHKIPRILND